MSTEKQVQVQRKHETHRLYAMFLHLSAILFGVFGPLVFWLVKRNDSRFINRHGIHAINFQLSMFAYSVAAFILCFFIIGFFILPFLPLLNIVCCLTAAVKAADGERFIYPLCFSFIK